MKMDHGMIKSSGVFKVIAYAFGASVGASLIALRGCGLSPGIHRRAGRAVLQGPGSDVATEAEVDRIDAENNKVILKNGTQLAYDILIIATGARTAPDQTEGMLDGDWRRRVFDFYTFEGAAALRHALEGWKGGRLVVHVCEMPIKCPVAPLEFTFLADWWLTKRGLRDK